jgi:hypothetical protein
MTGREALKDLKECLECEGAYDEVNKARIEIIEKELEVLDIIRMARKNIEAGRYIDYDNSCLMIKDYEGSVVDWYKLDESKIAKVNEVLNNV